MNILSTNDKKIIKELKDQIDKWYRTIFNNS